MTGTRLPIQRLYTLKSGSTDPQQLTSTVASETNASIVRVRFSDSQPSLTEVGDTQLYFAAQNADNVKQLFRALIDPSGNPVGQVDDMILLNGKSSNPTNLVEVTDGNVSTLYLVANTVVGDAEVVRINEFNGGAFDASKFTVFDLNGQSLGANAAQLTYVNQTKRLYFVADNGNTSDRELYRIDTTAIPGANNPQLVADINPGATGSNPSKLTNVNGRLVFVASDGTGTSPTTDSLNLWVADSAGAVKMSTLSSTNGRPLTNTDGSSFVTNIADSQDKSPFAVVGDTFFFAGTNATVGSELRKITLGGSTGSGITTTLRSYDIFPGTTNGTANSSTPNGLTAVGSLIYFVADNGSLANGIEPWSILG